ncbi:uncharacterized protein LOC122306893 isoform X1 [Carya illinoinensis]|uniref:uncharacterized protein LOC122306893 isoform X1 n=1 Tax=Carya illinoinensis TaxID=32201 RepID=UPI001C71B567|nr:uncharacterized protein LOC122306893 isoform X1 [Carya illinoinensis]
MGKCMKKLKIAGDVAVIMESSHSPHAASIGVCTRAKLLALQRLQKTTLLPAVAPNPDASSLSFLQLRSRRRLQKPPLFRKQQLHQHQLQPTQRCRERPSPRPNSRPRVGRVEEEEQGCVGAFPKGNESEDSIDFGVEASFGMELDGGDSFLEIFTLSLVTFGVIQQPHSVKGTYHLLGMHGCLWMWSKLFFAYSHGNTGPFTHRLHHQLRFYFMFSIDLSEGKKIHFTASNYNFLFQNIKY